jgi:hypothetical protein
MGHWSLLIPGFSDEKLTELLKRYADWWKDPKHPKDANGLPLP